MKSLTLYLSYNKSVLECVFLTCIKHISHLVLDPNHLPTTCSEFNTDTDWSHVGCGNVEKAKPLNSPKPLGELIDLCLFVVSDHTDVQATH